MRNYILAFTLVLGLMMGCSSQVSNQKTNNKSADDLLTLHVASNNQVVFEGEKMPIDKFKDELAALDVSPDAVFEFSVDLEKADIKAGTVADIQKIMRDAGTLRINYTALQ